MNGPYPFVTTPVTNASLTSISFKNEGILKNIHSLDIKKVYTDIMIYL